MTYPYLRSQKYGAGWSTDSASFIRPRRFGTGWWARTSVRPLGLPSDETFGLLAVYRVEFITSAGNIASVETYGTITVSPGAVNISVTGLSSLEAVQSITVTTAYTITATGLGTSEVWGGILLSPGGVTLTITAMDTAEGVGSVVISVGNVAIALAAITTAEAYGTTVITTGEVFILPGGIATAETLGDTTFLVGDVNLGVEAPPGDETYDRSVELGYLGGGANTLATISTDFARNGTKSIKLTPSATVQAHATVVQTAVITAQVDTYPGEVWYWEFWYYAPDTNTGNITIVPHKGITATTESYSNYPSASVSGIAPRSGWQKYTETYTIPSDHAYNKVRFTVALQASQYPNVVYLDDLYVTRVGGSPYDIGAAAISLNTFVWPNTIMGLDSNIAEGITTTEQQYWRWAGNTTVDTSFSESGASVRMDARAGNSYVLYQLPVTPGDVIAWSLDKYKSADFNGTSGYTKIRIGDTTGVSDPWTTGTLLYSPGLDGGATEQWVAQSGSYTVAAGVYQIGFSISSDATVGTIWYDNINIAITNSVGSNTVSPGAVDISPSALASAETYGTQVLSVGPVSIVPTAIDTTEALGTQVLTTGAVNITATAMNTNEAFGTPGITTGAVNITATAMASAEAYGTQVLSVGPVSVVPSAMDTEEGYSSGAVVFAEYTETRVTQTGATTPNAAGAYVTALGAGGGGGRGYVSGSTNRGGGGGGGGGSRIARVWVSRSEMASTYSTVIGTGGASQTDGGDTSFISGTASLVAGGGKKGGDGTQTTQGSAGNGGTAVVSGIAATATTYYGSSGGLGGHPSSSTPTGLAGNGNANHSGAGGGGGSGIRGDGQYWNVANGGNGGTADKAGGTGGTANVSNTPGGTGTSGTTGEAGGGGGGAALGSGWTGNAGGPGGTYGAGGGGSSANSNSYKNGGAGSGGDLVVEWKGLAP